MADACHWSRQNEQEDPMKTLSTAALLMITIITLALGAGPAEARFGRARAKVNKARKAKVAKRLCSLVPRPVLRYPSGNKRWLGWKVPPGKAGKLLPMRDIVQQNLTFGYRDVYRGDKSVGRRGGLLFTLDRGLDRAARWNKRKVAPVVYDWLGL
jgi:hypothetical protein